MVYIWDMEKLIFLKLGGSLITDKERPRTARVDVLAHLCRQIADCCAHDRNLSLLIGHGSGSFGHVAAKKYATRQGIIPSLTSPNSFPLKGKARMGAYWHGFTEVWHEARELNKIVMDAFRAAKIPALAISPSSGVVARDGKVDSWSIEPIKRALAEGIVPVVYGDVVFDEILGGTILSTEELFIFLARELHPQRILLAGLEDGIYADFPARKRRVARVSPASYPEIRRSIGVSAGTDVTGGMDSKVEQMLKLVEEIPALAVQIFSGVGEGNLGRVLNGEELGTLIYTN